MTNLELLEKVQGFKFTNKALPKPYVQKVVDIVLLNGDSYLVDQEGHKTRLLNAHFLKDGKYYSYFELLAIIL